MANILVFSYGNPGRGDDALGPAFAEILQRHDKIGLGDIDFLTDMQLQVEHVTDLCGRSLLLFVDADASCEPPFQLTRSCSTQDTSYTSHAMSPGALLFAFQQVYGVESPPAFLLRIRGYRFELGEAICTQAKAHLDEALGFALELFANPEPECWKKYAEFKIGQA